MIPRPTPEREEAKTPLSMPDMRNEINVMGGIYADPPNTAGFSLPGDFDENLPESKRLSGKRTCNLVASANAFDREVL